MKFIAWCVGWLVIALWADLAAALQPRVWPLVLAAVLWCLLGLGIGLITLVRLSLGNLGAGMKGLVRPPIGSMPTPQQKPKEGA